MGLLDDTLKTIARDVMFDERHASDAAVLTRVCDAGGATQTFNIRIVEDDEDQIRRNGNAAVTAETKLICWVPIHDTDGSEIAQPDDRCFLKLDGQDDSLYFTDMLEKSAAGYLCCFGKREIRAVGPFSANRHA